MTARSALAAGLLAVLVTGCHHGNLPPSQSTLRAAPGSSATTPTPAISTAPPAGEVAGLDAVMVARAFTAAICPYDWRNPIPYGTQLDTALARWGTAEFAAAHGWSPARTATTAAGLVDRQAQQVCGQVTGGLDPESDLTGRTVTVRLSVTVTAQAAGSSSSSAQQAFDYQLLRSAGGRWLISSGRW